MTTDLLPTGPTSMLAEHNGYPDDYDVDDDDADDDAGYQAMMQELPTIVSMSGLLDGDFDELNEIENLLAPVSDDDDIEEGYAAAKKAVDAAEASSDAYIQAMVPNPIPTEGFFDDGYEVSAKAAALDEGLGFPSNALMTVATTAKDSRDSSVHACTNLPLSVQNPVPTGKRVHNQLDVALVTPVPSNAVQPLRKKAKLDTAAKTPATIRTSLDGITAPNPLLFGRPIKLPVEEELQDTVPSKSQPKAAKTKLKIRSSSKPKAPSASTSPPQQQKPSFNLPTPTLRKVDPPKLRKPAKFLAPEQISSYPVPTFFLENWNTSHKTRPPLCKLVVKGKVETTLVGATDSANARISAPPLKIQPAGINSCPSSSSSSTDNDKTKISVTASKKKASTTSKNKKKPASASSTSISAKLAKKKATTLKAKKSSKNKANSANPHDIPNAAASDVSSKHPDDVPSEPTATPKMEKFLVANPLDNVPPSEPVKVFVPSTSISSKPPTAVTASTTAEEAPAVVSSNSSAASVSEIPEQLSSSDATTPEDSATTMANKDSSEKTTSSSRPASKEERAQACRDRNRTHARNTRLRKKAYVEELKRSLLDLVELRDQDLDMLQKDESRTKEHRQTRRRVLQDFLELRGRNERDEAKWEQLVKDPKTFQLSLPLTKFQTMVGVTNDEKLSMRSAGDQVLVGLQDVMSDAEYHASFLQNLGTTTGAEKTPVYLQYKTDESPLLMDGSTGILNWKATTCGAMSQGAKAELVSCGTVRGIFCPDSNKLVSAALLFDTGVIQAQLPTPLHV